MTNESRSAPEKQPFAVPRTHRLTVPDSIVIVGALVFAGFLCARGVEPQTALTTTILAVGALMFVVVAPRAVMVLLRELGQPRGD